MRGLSSHLGRLMRSDVTAGDYSYYYVLPRMQASLDEPLSDGWHYPQASGVPGQGFDLRDLPSTAAGPALFWTHVQSMGGVAVLGYPVSRAFLGRDGCVY